MSKTKMRCNVCGKWFQSANAKDITCPDCTQKARKEKLAAKQPPTAQPTGQAQPGANMPQRVVPPPPKPKPASGGTSHWLDAQNDVKVGQPDQPRPKPPSSPAPRDIRGGQERGDQHGPTLGGYRDRDERGPSGYRDREGNNRGPGVSSGPGGPGNYRGPSGYRENDYRGPNNYRPSAPYRVGGGMGLPDTVEPRPRQPMTGNRPPRPDIPGEGRPDKFRPGPGGKPPLPKGKKPSKPKSETPPKPKREKIPPPEPFKPTDEQIAQVENRYIELAVPTEFDGIRTQIATELSIPKVAVKKIIKELRDRQNIPSWWEIQTYKGSNEELEKIKAAYEPHLPLPAVGVHKQIAEQLSLKPGEVYQAIKAIRLEMNLPQYNDPALHGLELKPKKAKESEQVTPAEPGAEDQAQNLQTDQPTPAEAPAAEQKPAADQAEPVTETEEKPQESATEEKPQESANAEKPQESASEFTSIETDVKFQQVGDTTEVVAASTPDTSSTEA